MKKVYFTFNQYRCPSHHPYKDGYMIIKASTEQEAIKIFDSIFPSKTEDHNFFTHYVLEENEQMENIAGLKYYAKDTCHAVLDTDFLPGIYDFFKAEIEKLNETDDFEYSKFNYDKTALINVYYNVDCVSSGQIVVDYYNIKNTILPYLDELDGDYSKFDYSKISDKAEQFLYDFDDIYAIKEAFGWVLKDRLKYKGLGEMLEQIDTKAQIETIKANINDISLSYGENKILHNIVDLYTKNQDETYRKGIIDSFEATMGKKLKDFTREIIKSLNEKPFDDIEI